MDKYPLPTQSHLLLMVMGPAQCLDHVPLIVWDATIYIYKCYTIYTLHMFTSQKKGVRSQTIGKAREAIMVS